MLYLGDFTYNGERSDEDVWEESAFGWFTLLVEAESAKEAIERFGNLIESVDDRTDTFASAREVYIEVAIEVRELPEEGVLAYWHENFGVINASLSTSLPRRPGTELQPSRGAATNSQRRRRTRRAWCHSTPGEMRRIEGMAPALSGGRVSHEIVGHTMLVHILWRWIDMRLGE